VRLTINAAKSHASTGTDESRECLAVGSNELAALSRVLLLLVEVEDELLIREEGEAVGGTKRDKSVSCSCDFQLMIVTHVSASWSWAVKLSS
jgi:hypothetical protein